MFGGMLEGQHPVLRASLAEFMGYLAPNQFAQLLDPPPCWIVPRTIGTWIFRQFQSSSIIEYHKYLAFEACPFQLGFTLA